MDRELMSMLGTLHGGVNVVVAIAVLVLGLVLVRPKHATAGLVLAGAGGARLVGILLSWGLHALRPTDGGYEVAMGMSLVSSLLSMLFAGAFWGGIVFAALQMADAVAKRGST